jgi:hypothetical protein
VDKLQWELNDNEYYTIRYVNDIAILIIGKFPQTMSEVLQTDLGIVLQWCDRTNFSINPNMMVIIPFSRKRGIKGLKEPTLFNKTIQLSSEIMYLRLMLHKGLTRKKQLGRVISEIYRAFLTCKGMFGRICGLRPQVIHWIHTVVVRPIVTYAATVWWNRIKLRISRAELSKLQRMACWGITGAMRTTPTAANEVLLEVPPLHLQLEAEARARIYSLYCSDQWKSKSEDFGRAYMTQRMKEEPILQMDTDKMILRHVYDKPFMVRFPDRSEWKDGFQPGRKGTA